MSLDLKAWALLSGGKDSVTLAHVLAAQGMLAGCVAFDTGIAVPDWRPFIERLCASQGWPLHIVGTLVRYDDLVRKSGFPGPGQHSTYMNWLKGRALRLFKKRSPDALLASGVRRGESQRRFGTVREWGVMDGVPIWAPLVEWTTEDVWTYVRAHDLPRAPAYTTLGISGDCLCGAFAEKNEREALADCYPAFFRDRIEPLERETGGRWGCGRKARGRVTKSEQLICVECDPSGRPDSGTRGCTPSGPPKEGTA